MKQAKLCDLEISGTPTFAVIDKYGLVNSIWLGKIPDARKEKLLRSLAQTKRRASTIALTINYF